MINLQNLKISDQDAKSLKERFLRDTGIKGDLIREPYFTARMLYLEEYCGAWTQWKALLDEISGKYGGNVSEFLESYYNARNDMLLSICPSAIEKGANKRKAPEHLLEIYRQGGFPYALFNGDMDKLTSDAAKRMYEKMQSNMSHYFIGSYGKTSEALILGLSAQKAGDGKNVYTPDNDGCLFVEADLRMANFQAMRYFDGRIFGQDVYAQDGPLDIEQEYRKWASTFTDSEYVLGSKYVRQVVFGSLNPKREISIEQALAAAGACELSSWFDVSGIEHRCVAVNSDAVIFRIDPDVDRSKLVSICDRAAMLLRRQGVSPGDYMNGTDGGSCFLEDVGIHMRIRPFWLRRGVVTDGTNEFDFYMKEYLDKGLAPKFIQLDSANVSQVLALTDPELWKRATALAEKDAWYVGNLNAVRDILENGNISKYFMHNGRLCSFVWPLSWKR